MLNKPPIVLDGARVIEYAVIDETVTYTGKMCVIVGGKKLPPAEALVISQNLGDNKYLLFYCTAEWKVMGAGFFASIKDIKAYSELCYQGIMTKWIEFGTTEAEAREFMDGH